MMPHLSDSYAKKEMNSLLNEKSLINKALVSGNTALFYWEDGKTKACLSPSYYLLLGYPADTHSPQSGIVDHIHPEDRIKTESELKKCFDQQISQISLEFRSIDKNGRPLRMFFKGSMASSGNKPERKLLLGVVSNISTHQETEKILAEKERHLARLMNHLPGMVYRNRMIKGKWHAEFVSDGIIALLGYDREYFLANRKVIYSQLIEPDVRKDIWETIEESIRKNQPFELVYRINTATGNFKWVWEKGEVLLDDTGAPVLMEGFMMDITTFKHEEFRLHSFIRSASRERYRFGDIIGKSPEMQKIYEYISTASTSDASVIIYGESGTGKELVARAIHNAGKQRKGPLIIVNCAAISEKLLESEFFGYKKGAFTGAGRDKDGFLAAAEDGTLFLDELGDISLEFQVKLLRVLDGHGYTPVGGNKNQHANVRIIAATNRNLEKLVTQGRMRKDFYYRIHIIPITLPPLRKRRQDIPLLIDHFLEKHRRTGSEENIPGSIRQAMYEYSWPGNIRELENIIQRFLVLGTLSPFDNTLMHDREPNERPGISEAYSSGDLKTILDRTEKQVILNTLRKNHWRRGDSARDLNITPRTLYRKMMYHRIKPT